MPWQTLEIQHLIRERNKTGMCVMIERSRVSLEKSKYALNAFRKNDEIAYLDSACFDAQQAIEFLLKGVLMEYGAFFEEGGLPKHLKHNIGYILNKVTEYGFTFPSKDALSDISDTITGWEQEWGCGSGIKASVDIVLRAHKMYDDIMSVFLLNMDKNNKEENKREEVKSANVTSAMSDIDEGRTGLIPKEIRDSHSEGMHIFDEEDCKEILQHIKGKSLFDAVNASRESKDESNEKTDKPLSDVWTPQDSLYVEQGMLYDS